MTSTMTMVMVAIVIIVVVAVMLFALCRLDKEANSPMFVEQVVFASIASYFEDWMVVAFRVTEVRQSHCSTSFADSISRMHELPT